MVKAKPEDVLRERAKALNKRLNKDVKEAKKYNWVDQEEFVYEYGRFVSESVYPIEELLNNLWANYETTSNPDLLRIAMRTYSDLERSLVTVSRIITEWVDRVSLKTSSHVRNAYVKYIKHVNHINSVKSAHFLNVHKRAAALREESGLTQFEEEDRVHEQTIRDLHEMAAQFVNKVEEFKNILKEGKEYKQEDTDDFLENMNIIFQGLEQVTGEIEEQLLYYAESRDPNAITRIMEFYKNVDHYYEGSKRLDSSVIETVPSPVRQKVRMQVRETVRDINRKSLDTVEKVRRRFGTGTRESFRYEREWKPPT